MRPNQEREPIRVALADAIEGALGDDDTAASWASQIRALEAERDRYGKALEKIAGLLQFSENPNAAHAARLAKMALRGQS